MRGGLGFQNIYGFNLAMLGKQVWSLIQKPDSLVSRVLRAKYYPTGDIINSTRKRGSSFIWSGLWKAKEELKSGFRWVVGDGRSINVLTYPWLRWKNGFLVDKREYNLSLSTKVCLFFQSGLKQ